MFLNKFWIMLQVTRFFHIMLQPSAKKKCLSLTTQHPIMTKQKENFINFCKCIKKDSKTQTTLTETRMKLRGILKWFCLLSVVLCLPVASKHTEMFGVDAWCSDYLQEVNPTMRHTQNLSIPTVWLQQIQTYDRYINNINEWNVWLQKIFRFSHTVLSCK